MIAVAPGDTLRVALQVLNTSDVPTDADATPAFALWRNGAVDGAVSFTVTKPASTTGLYMASCTVPSTYAEGDYLHVRATGALSTANRAWVPLQVRVTNRVNALEALAENQGVLLAQLAGSMTNAQAEINTVRQVLAAGVSLSTAERTEVSNSIWSHTDGRDLVVSVCGIGGVPGADSNNLTNHDFVRNGTTVRHRINAAGTYRHCSRVSG